MRRKSWVRLHLIPQCKRSKRDYVHSWRGLNLSDFAIWLFRYSSSFLLKRLALFSRAIFEAGEFLSESKRNVASRAVALLGDDQVSFALSLVFFLFGIGVIFLPNEETHHIGVLLDAA